MVLVQVWDKALVNAVDQAIRNADLGLNPMMDGTLLRMPIPELNAERRQELAKVAAQYAEQARVAVRHVRRDGMDSSKKRDKDGHDSQDDKKLQHDEDPGADRRHDQGNRRRAARQEESEIMQV